ncbi:GAF domain-containing sensor histidine kinase [Laspinema olomoucense]|uniref:histidine kinase n=1 Tax=Laspinema olomoucense D3b TaxID=2953688 RepID=A0ABT2N6F0_9CYAN|nr:GAF domain-containing protein [Laspinema sp. D3b]MCT7978152.1 GAF domain-containing protein [Laspinema sp. D3b]
MLNSFFLLPRVIPTVSLSNPLEHTKIEDPQKRSALLRKVIDQIWQSLDLKTILQTAVDEIAAMLNLDACSFLWYFERTERVQVVCKRTRNQELAALEGTKPLAEVGYHPLDIFGTAASAIAQGQMVISCGPLNESSTFGAMTRLIANCPVARPPQNLIQGHENQPPEMGQPTPGTATLDALANLLVPVKGQEGWIGFIACLSQNPRTWSTAEVEFVQLIAQQLEIAIRQAQLYDRVQKQAQRERLVNQIVNQTRQSFDLETILTQAIAQLLEALEVDRCLIHLVEDREEGLTGEHHREGSFWNAANDVAFRREHLFEVCRPPFPSSIDDFDTHGPITQWTIAHREEVVISDVSEDPRIGKQNEEYDKAEIKSSMVMPVQANGRLHAILYINQCSRVRQWSKHDRELARAVADQLAISIQQACLYAQKSATMERESLLRLIGEHIRRTLDINTILQTSAREVRQLLGADRVAIYQFSTETAGKIVVEESTSQLCLREAVKEHDCFYQECADQLQSAQQPLVRAVEDVYKTHCNDEYLACWQHLQVRASLSVPISRGSEVWGLLIVHECHKPRGWRTNEIELLEQLADQLAIAIHQAELYDRACANAIAAETKAAELEQALRQLQETQAQLIQSEKMSSLGQLVAGVAHEINNPVNFIYGNLSHVDGYAQDMLKLIEAYQKRYPDPGPEIEEIAEEIDLNFLRGDMPKVLNSMKIGADRIREIVLSLRNFSRLDQAEMKLANLHEGIDNTLLILQNRLRAKAGHLGIELVKDYGKLPRVECYPGQLNQVLMNIISNGIDALESYNESRSIEEISQNPSRITIRTQWVKKQGHNDRIIIAIADNGPGIPHHIKARLFDPFFTTKAVGKGTGLGLSISYQIVVEKHKGAIECISEPGQGAEFVIEIPVRQSEHTLVPKPQLMAVGS